MAYSNILTEITDFARKNKNVSFVKFANFLKKKDVSKHIPSIINSLLRRSLFDNSFNIFETSVSKSLIRIPLISDPNFVLYLSKRSANSRAIDMAFRGKNTT
ncbi:hypothetical protein, partial [Acetobacter tropicalis]|uniref:hypothetical protein n=1 Tax=Acetobacter tropicalis TaxID=104102 RepID=UPI001C996FB8